MDRQDISQVLEAIADLLELQGENAFKIRAYRTGARALDALEEDLGTVISEERLDQVRGIGKALVQKITELHQTGELAFYNRLKAEVPAGLVELLEVPGLGPKKIKKLYDELGVDSVTSLRQAAESGRVSELAGFGKKTQEQILHNLANREAYLARHLWWTAAQTAEPILEGLRARPEIQRAEAAGSLRRGMETVGDLDFLGATDDPAPVMDWFCTLDAVEAVTAHGRTKSSVRLAGGLQADLRLVPPERFAFALHHFTGSKNHNVRMRQRALERGLSLSEWGLFKVGDEPEDSPAKQSERKPVVACETEEALFEALGLAYIPPALREDRGEIEQAEQGPLPPMLETSQLRGAFHNHTTASDGRHTLEEMAAAAEALGWEYLGISDHSKSSFQARGLDEERLLAQVEAIHRLNASGQFKVHLFTGSEVDILKDGSLDFSNDILAQLDCVVASVHQAFTQDEPTMTRRLIKALENPHVTMLGHLTGRILLRREPYALNIPKIIDAAIANGKIIELNANPKRLDMDWRHWRKAADKGLLTSINPDAHHVDHLQFVQAGINVARKAWLQSANILNCAPLNKVKSTLQNVH